jgi:hypothetical protein
MALLMALVAMSCSDDSTNPDDGGDGGGGGDNLPSTMITIVTTANNEEVDSKTIEKVDNKYVPSDYTVTGSYHDITTMFSLSFSQLQQDYVFQLNSRILEYKTGTYNYVENDGNFLLGSYVNKNLGERSYMSKGATLVITKITYVGNNQIGTYYTDGTLSMDFINDANATPEVKVVATFEGVPISTVISVN